MALEQLPYSTEKVQLRNKNLFTSTVDNNEAHKRYFSSIDAEIYFGETFIDDINRIEYAVVEKVLPVYGYNSHLYDFLLYGTRYIQGEFTINFTKSGWLLDVIKGLTSIATSNNSTDVGQCCVRTDSCGITSGGLFDGIFDIVVSFGDFKSTINSFGSSAHMIKGVRINGYNQVLDSSGQPIQETYSFIAQDIVFNIEDSNWLDNTFSTGNNNTTISHTESNSVSQAKLQLADGRSKQDITYAQQEAKDNNALSLATVCVHEISDDIGSLVVNLNILNDKIDKKDIKINKIAITPSDRRSTFKNLPIFKSTDFRYSYDSNKDIISIISLKDLSTYDRLIYNYFKKEKNNAYIDASISIEIDYKDTPLVFNNKPIKILPGASYNF